MSNVMNNLSHYKYAISDELASQAGLTKEELTQILNNRKLYEQFKSQKTTELATENQVVSNSINDLIPIYNHLANQYLTGNKTVDSVTEAGLTMTVPLEKEEKDKVEIDLRSLIAKGEQLNSEWRATHWYKPDKEFLFDFSMPTHTSKISANREMVAKYIKDRKITLKDVMQDKGYNFSEEDIEWLKSQFPEEAGQTETSLLGQSKNPSDLVIYNAKLFNEIFNEHPSGPGFYNASEIYDKILNAKGVKEEDRYIALDNILRNALSEDNGGKYKENPNMIDLVKRIHSDMEPLLKAFKPGSKFHRILSTNWNDYKNILGGKVKVKDVTKRKKDVTAQAIIKKPINVAPGVEASVTGQRGSISEIIKPLSNERKMNISRAIHESWLNLPKAEQDKYGKKANFNKEIIDAWDVDPGKFKTDKEMAENFEDFIRKVFNLDLSAQ